MCKKTFLRTDCLLAYELDNTNIKNLVRPIVSCLHCYLDLTVKRVACFHLLFKWRFRNLTVLKRASMFVMRSCTAKLGNNELVSISIFVLAQLRSIRLVYSDRSNKQLYCLLITEVVKVPPSVKPEADRADARSYENMKFNRGQKLQVPVRLECFVWSEQTPQMYWRNAHHYYKILTQNSGGLTIKGKSVFKQKDGTC